MKTIIFVVTAFIGGLMVANTQDGRWTMWQTGYWIGTHMSQPNLQTHEQLMQWAARTVNDRYGGDKRGSYDACEHYRKDYEENTPELFAIQDACALILHGGEW